MASDKRRTHTREDVVAAYRNHMRMLDKSCADFDKGDYGEALRIALALRVLLHDGKGRVRSLLKQVGLKDVLFFDSAEDVNPANLMPTLCLVTIRMVGPEAEFVAPLGMHMGRPVWMLPFAEWWQRTVIAVPGQFSLSRGELVHVMADQGGGAHFDEAIDDRYYRLTRENALGLRVCTPIGDRPIDGIERATIRQIAQEVRASLVEPRRTIPPDMPEAPSRPAISISTNATTGEVIRREVPSRLWCPCKSGLSYAECHKAGGRNATGGGGVNDREHG